MQFLPTSSYQLRNRQAAVIRVEVWFKLANATKFGYLGKKKLWLTSE
jgi:hypothetical protein